MKLSRSDYEDLRLKMTKRLLRLALQAREAKIGKITDGRVLLDFMLRGAFAATGLLDEALADAGIEVEPDALDLSPEEARQAADLLMRALAAKFTEAEL